MLGTRAKESGRMLEGAAGLDGRDGERAGERGESAVEMRRRLQASLCVPLWCMSAFGSRPPLVYICLSVSLCCGRVCLPLWITSPSDGCPPPQARAPQCSACAPDTDTCQTLHPKTLNRPLPRALSFSFAK